MSVSLYCSVEPCSSTVDASQRDAALVLAVKARIDESVVVSSWHLMMFSRNWLVIQFRGLIKFTKARNRSYACGLGCRG